MVALGKLDEFDPETSFAAWVGQIVRYLALNERRRRGRERAALADSSFAEAAAPRPLSIGTSHSGVTSAGQLLTDQRLFDDELTAAVATLDDIPRSCLLLRVVLELPYREIAQVLGIPEGTAMSHVHRSRRALYDHLSSGAERSSAQKRSSP